MKITVINATPGTSQLNHLDYKKITYALLDQDQKKARTIIFCEDVLTQLVSVTFVVGDVATSTAVCMRVWDQRGVLWTVADKRVEVFHL